MSRTDGCCHQGGHRASSGRLADEGDASRVAAEVLDLLLHPPEGGELVEQPSVVRGTLQVGEPLHSHPVLHGDDHDAGPGQRGTVVHRLRCVPDPVGTAVDPHHHG
jgi:hypothetical protein